MLPAAGSYAGRHAYCSRLLGTDHCEPCSAGERPAQLEYDWTHWSGAEEGEEQRQGGSAAAAGPHGHGQHSSGSGGMPGSTSGSTGGSASGSAGGSGRPAAGGPEVWQQAHHRSEPAYFPEDDPPNRTLVLLNLATGDWRPAKGVLYRTFGQYGTLLGGAHLQSWTPAQLDVCG